MRHIKMSAFCLSVAMLMVLWRVPAALAEESPQRGGILRVAIAGDPPSLDMHQESTFMVTIPMSTVYNTLVMFDPHAYPNIIGDLAKLWEVAGDLPDLDFPVAPRRDLPRRQGCAPPASRTMSHITVTG